MKDEGGGMKDEGGGMKDEGGGMKDEGGGMKDEGGGMKDEGGSVNRDLRGRTRGYASATVKLYCSLPTNRIEVQVIGRQLLKSGTAVAAIYREAFRARSDAEFISKIETSLQEADESDLWLDLLEADCGIKSESLTWLRRETNELISIFVTVVKNVKKRNSK